MLGVALLAFGAAALFAAFHVPVRVLSSGRPARLIGIAYHLLLLPVVVALPAPEWAKAAGLAWMLIDVALNGAAYVGLRAEIGDALRQGVHVLSATWVIVAGWTNGIGLGVAGTLLAAAFLTRFLAAGTAFGARPQLRWINAVLNVIWMVSVGVFLLR